jgi:predicted O-methyltransferase YrrM
MNDKVWTDVDGYIADKLLGSDPVLDAVLEANRDAGLPAIDVSAAQGKLLNLLVRISGAKRILEIGTLGGYSTICLARGLPADGRLITLEYEPRHAEVARSNLLRAGLSEKVEVRVGAAAGLLPKVAADGLGPFDLVFIDADKPSNPIYLDWAIRLTRPGSIVILDNVVRDGAVIDARSSDANVVGSRAAYDFFAAHKQLDATAIQTVGSKGYDGFAIALVK